MEIDESSERIASTEDTVVGILKQLEDGEGAPSAENQDDLVNSASIVSSVAEESSRTLMVVCTIPAPMCPEESGEFNIRSNASFRVNNVNCLKIVLKIVYTFSGLALDNSSSLDVTSISDSNAEIVEGALNNDSSILDSGDSGKEGVCTSTPLANSTSRVVTVSNLVQPVAFLEVSDDSDTSSKRSCKSLEASQWTHQRTENSTKIILKTFEFQMEAPNRSKMTRICRRSNDIPFKDYGLSIRPSTFSR